MQIMVFGEKDFSKQIGYQHLLYKSSSLVRSTTKVRAPIFSYSLVTSSEQAVKMLEMWRHYVSTRWSPPPNPLCLQCLKGKHNLVVYRNYLYYNQKTRKRYILKGVCSLWNTVSELHPWPGCAHSFIPMSSEVSGFQGEKLGKRPS